MSDREYWHPTPVDAALAARLRADYPERANLSDEDLFDHFQYSGKYATTWDHIGDAYNDYEPLADDWMRLRAIEAAAREAVTALAGCYDVQSYPGDGSSLQDRALAALRRAVGGEEG